MNFNRNTLLTIFLTSTFSMPMLANAESSEEMEDVNALYAYQFNQLDKNDNHYLAWTEIKNKDTINHKEFMKADVNNDVRLNANEYANAKVNDIKKVLKSINTNNHYK